MLHQNGHHFNEYHYNDHRYNDHQYKCHRFGKKSHGTILNEWSTQAKTSPGEQKVDNQPRE